MYKHNAPTAPTKEKQMNTNPTREAIEAGITLVDELVQLTSLKRGDVIQACRRMEKKGLGKLVVGRKGHPSRFERFLDTDPKRTVQPPANSHDAGFVPAVPGSANDLSFLLRKMSRKDADLALKALAAKYGS
jgi:hypothetical protein